VIRLAPPMTLTADETEEAVEILRAAIAAAQPTVTTSSVSRG
jgi:4-aminobutyrate aminotransferase-like enzyme